MIDFQVRRACTPDEYQCANGQCISCHLRCDLRPDCVDGTDEEHCGKYNNDLLQRLDSPVYGIYENPNTIAIKKA